MTLYASFESPVTDTNCGDYCAPYNELGIPFCCDTRHIVPSAYLTEWEYLSKNTDLWRQWVGVDREKTGRMQSITPNDQVLIECRGHKLCIRHFRSLVCRAFPFFPYITTQGHFIGITYYWDYEDRCWVINNLRLVSPKFVSECISAFDTILNKIPQEKENYRYHSSRMRRGFSQRHRTIPLFHRDGFTCEVIPRNGQMRRMSMINLPRFGPYKIAEELPFPEKVEPG
jgi:hypothetical protein